MKKQNRINTRHNPYVRIKNATSGITLIALVVTIIVLLILAGVTIATLTGENGILTRASSVKEKQRGAEVNEIVLLAVNENQIAGYTDDAKKNKTEVVEELFAAGKITEEEKNKLLGLNGEREIDVITIGGIEIDFSKLNVGCPLKFGQPYSYMVVEGTESFAITYIFYKDGSVKGLYYKNGQVADTQSMAAGYVKYEDLNIIYAEKDVVIGVISPSGMQVEMEGDIYILGEPTPLPDAPEEPTALKIEYTSITLNTIPGCEYSMDGETWQDSTVFSGLEAGTKYMFFARYKATASEPASYVSYAEISTDAPEVPEEPTALKIDYSSIILNTIEGCEYSIDGVIWQDSTTFSDLNSSTEYTFYARYKATGDIPASSPSTAKISTIEAPPEPTPEEFFSYVENEDGENTVTITGLNPNISTYYSMYPNASRTDWIFPETVTINGVEYTVTRIGSENVYGSFEYNYNVTSVKIPSTVTTILDYTFQGCSNLTSVTIENKVTNIGNSAFNWCKGLEIVYYKGTESEWQNISIGTGNDFLTGAAIYYNQ